MKDGGIRGEGNLRENRVAFRNNRVICLRNPRRRYRPALAEGRDRRSPYRARDRVRIDKITSRISSVYSKLTVYIEIGGFNEID